MAALCLALRIVMQLSKILMQMGKDDQQFYLAMAVVSQAIQVIQRTQTDLKKILIESRRRSDAHRRRQSAFGQAIP